MKKISKSSLIMSTLALGAGVVLVSGVANGLKIDTSTVADHVLRLHSLILGSDNSQTYIKSNNDNLAISGGLVVGLGNSSNSNAVVAGGSGNKIGWSSNYSVIAGGSGNNINNNSKNAVIGGGKSNTITGENAVIMGGSNNEAGSGGVVLGGNKNKANNNGVALGGQNNEAGTNSLAMGSGAKAASGSFAWSATARNGEARIDAKSGLLINTGTAINGVNLLVNGMIKVGGNAITGDEQAGEIRFVKNCFYSYDGTGWHVMTTLTGGCNDISTKKSCQWGDVVLQHGDSATGYKKEFGTSCSGEKVWCDNGNIVKESGIIDTYYPYCHKLN